MHDMGSTIWLLNICMQLEAQFGYRTSTYYGKQSLVTEHLPAMGSRNTVWLQNIYLQWEQFG